ncbi:Protein of unknown function [Cotesia congregata]|uniref:Uncharacterized protein n=1 Tax=Cotesia congregata TaxID=51543 RepID=A0A8J2HIX7_COTCN|nr:Protein of unknown function [Cotesia congregata]
MNRDRVYCHTLASLHTYFSVPSPDKIEKIQRECEKDECNKSSDNNKVLNLIQLTVPQCDHYYQRYPQKFYQPKASKHSATQQELLDGVQYIHQHPEYLNQLQIYTANVLHLHFLC